MVMMMLIMGMMMRMVTRRMILMMRVRLIILTSMVLTIRALTLFPLGPVSSHLPPLRHFVLNNLDKHHDHDDHQDNDDDDHDESIVLSSCRGIPQECSACGSSSWP